MTENSQPTLVITLKAWHGFVLGVVLTLVLLVGLSACYQGRKISRITWRPVSITLPADVTSYSQVVSISFHKTPDGETIKDVTYMGRDEKLHSHEYNDWGIFQGEIIWELNK